MKYTLIIIAIIASFISIVVSVYYYRDYTRERSKIYSDAQKLKSVHQALKSYKWDWESIKNYENILDEKFGDRDWRWLEGAGCGECNPGPYIDIKYSHATQEIGFKTNDKVQYSYFESIEIDNNGDVTIK